jgi:hypothetical protein
MKITLNNQSYSLKFGLGFFRQLGKVYGDTTLNQTLARLSVLDGVKDDIPYEFMDLIENLVIAAINNGDNLLSDDDEAIDYILDTIFADPKILQDLIAGIVESMPKQTESQGKIPAPKKNGAKN